MNSSIEKITLSPISESTSLSNSALVDRDMGLVAHVDVEVMVNVGSVLINIEKLFSLKAGEVIKLEESIDTPLTLIVAGKAVARGNLVAVDDNFGIEIIEIS